VKKPLQRNAARSYSFTRCVSKQKNEPKEKEKYPENAIEMTQLKRYDISVNHAFGV
jgi:hypothetical protein